MPLKMKRKSQAGVSLVEIMVALTLGLLLLAGMSTLFANNSRARDEIEMSYQQIENGRYAMQALTDELHLAGYLAEFDINSANLTLPAVKPDPCVTTIADLTASLRLYLQGYDSPASADIPSCLSDVKSGTDIFVVRRVLGCVSGSAECAAVAGAPYFQASLCNDSTELGSGSTSDQFRLSTVDANLNRHKRDCTTLADKRRYTVRIYYIANNDKPGDGIPTLKRAELGSDGTVMMFGIAPIAEGIENLQIEYGMDTTNDGIPDSYTANPDSFNACATPADCVENWPNVMAVRLNLLARNTTRSIGYSDTKTYSLGANASGSVITVGPFNDAYKRHAYETEVRLNNPAIRRQQ